MQTDHLTEDLLIHEEEFERASSGKRFVNYLIDVIVFYLLMFCLGIVIALISPTSLDDIGSDNTSFGLVDRILSLILYALYMSIVEALFKGRSLGKLITGTKAVNLDGSNISLSTAFARGFSRAVPFCALSAFGNPCNPWQDRWTNTMVITLRSSTLTQ